MSKEEIGIEPERLGRAIWRTGWRMGILFGLAAILAVFAWMYAGSLAFAGGGLAYILLACVHAFLAVLLERGFALIPISRGWRLRLAFLLPVGMFISQWVWMAAFQLIFTSLFETVLVFFGAFVGALAATTRTENLWENNSPPSEQVQTEVWLRHVHTIGDAGPEPFLKRAFDFTLALLGLAVSAPVWIASIFLIWMEDPGPVLFVKNSVGKGGANFRQFKLRTMVNGAEAGTGPVLASVGDQRVLAIGRFLRKTALDELPQLLNILVGEMSFVGPRPQRTVLVRDYLEHWPGFAERHRVLPGLAGLAQVAGDYYLAPHQKLRLDRIYICHRNLGFDLKLLILAFLVAFWFRWQPGWNGRLPRRLIRFGASRSPRGSAPPPAN